MKPRNHKKQPSPSMLSSAVGLMVREELLLQEIFTSTLSPMERARILRGAAVAATVMARSLYDEIDRSTK